MSFGSMGLTALSLVVLFSFLLPWISFSCGRLELTAVSPVELMLDIPVRTQYDADGTAKDLLDEAPDGYGDLLLYVAGAGAAALFGLAAYWLPSMVRLLLPAIGISGLTLFYFRLQMMEYDIKNIMDNYLGSQPPPPYFGNALSQMQQNMVQAIDISVAVGFWTALLAFLAAFGLGVFAEMDAQQRRKQAEKTDPENPPASSGRQPRPPPFSVEIYLRGKSDNPQAPPTEQRQAPQPEP